MRTLLVICAFSTFLASVISQPDGQDPWKSSWPHIFPDGSHLSPPQDWQTSLPHISHSSSEHSQPAIPTNTAQYSWQHSFPGGSHLSPPQDWPPSLPHISHSSSEHSQPAISTNTAQSSWTHIFPDGSQLSPPQDWQPTSPHISHPSSEHSLPAISKNALQSSWQHSFLDGSQLSPPPDWQPSLPYISHPSSEHSRPGISTNTLQSSWPHIFPDGSHLSPPHDWQPSLSHILIPSSEHSWPDISTNTSQFSWTHSSHVSLPHVVESSLSHGVQPNPHHSSQPSGSYNVSPSLSQAVSPSLQPSLSHGPQSSQPKRSQPNQDYWEEVIVEDWGYSEVAFWNNGKLFYIDTYESKLCAYHPNTNHSTCCITGLGLLSFAVPVSGYPEEFVVGVGTSVILIVWNSSENKQQPLYVVLESQHGLPPLTRWNGGSVDQNSQIIIGTTDDYPQERERNLASVYSFNKNCKFLLKLENLPMIGGFAWAPRLAKDKKKKAPPVKFYLANAVKDEIVLYDVIQNYDNKIANPQKLFSLPHYGLNGHPGRLTVDVTGHLWVPLIEGHGVIEFDPVMKDTVRLVNLPAAKVGACTFGGPNMDILYVSTIGYEYKIPHESRPKDDKGGHIYAIYGLKAKGMPTREFKLNPNELPNEILMSRENSQRERTPAAHRTNSRGRTSKAARVEH